MFLKIKFVILLYLIKWIFAYNHEDTTRFIQPDDMDDTSYENFDRRGKHCSRICEENEVPKLCYYRFVIEHYSVMGTACGSCPHNITECLSPQCITTDGIERSILTVNRRYPGPSIQVCQGDTIVVDVKNSMLDRSTSIHWYGIHQKGTPYMDGTPMVTQCPINPGQIFRYQFKADNAGTYFWQSYNGFQKLDGVIGSLIIRQPTISDKNAKKYDKDLPSHIMLITDWMHNLADDKFPGPRIKNFGQIPITYLINGRGFDSRTTFDSNLFGLFRSSKIPITKFDVIHGLKYRFRIIGGHSLSCAFQLYIEQHKLLVITADSNVIEPVLADTLVILPGERYDVIVEANQQTGHYWIIVQGMHECNHAKQVAVLLYDAPNHYPLRRLSPYPSFRNKPTGAMFNGTYRTDCNKISTQTGCAPNIKSRTLTPKNIRESNPDIRLLFTFGFHHFDNDELFRSNGNYYRFYQSLPLSTVSGMINNISNNLSPSPLLTQFNDTPSNLFCSEHCVEMNSPIHCHCLHVVKIPLNAVVEFIIVDADHGKYSGLSYPFHLHGYDFYIVEIGVLNGNLFQEDIQEVVERIDSGLHIDMYLPKKDTIGIPASGYAVLRILADNPGFWMLNSNFIFAKESGMSVILQVGDFSDLPKVPQHFPKCSDYLPPIGIH